MESSQMGLVLISQLYTEGRITDDQRDNLKGIQPSKYISDNCLDMIFSDELSCSLSSTDMKEKRKSLKMLL